MSLGWDPNLDMKRAQMPESDLTLILLRVLSDRLDRPLRLTDLEQLVFEAETVGVQRVDILHDYDLSDLYLVLENLGREHLARRVESGWELTDEGVTRADDLLKSEHDAPRIHEAADVVAA
jgi:hypothetical protein